MGGVVIKLTQQGVVMVDHSLVEDSVMSRLKKKEARKCGNHLALLGGVADGVEEHEMLVYLRNSILLHHGLLQGLAHLLRLPLKHGGLVCETHALQVRKRPDVHVRPIRHEKCRPEDALRGGEDAFSGQSFVQERAELFRGTKVYISFATTLKTEAGLRNSNTREKGGDWPSSTSTYVTVSFLRSALLWKSV
eukprot:1185624-Prorocentrum_minimum.AAC.1